MSRLPIAMGEREPDAQSLAQAFSPLAQKHISVLSELLIGWVGCGIEGKLFPISHS